MGEADWYRVSELVRHDDSSFRTLVARQVKQASQLAEEICGALSLAHETPSGINVDDVLSAQWRA